MFWSIKSVFIPKQQARQEKGFPKSNSLWWEKGTKPYSLCLLVLHFSSKSSHLDAKFPLLVVSFWCFNLFIPLVAIHFYCSLVVKPGFKSNLSNFQRKVIAFHIHTCFVMRCYLLVNSLIHMPTACRFVGHCIILFFRNSEINSKWAFRNLNPLNGAYFLSSPSHCSLHKLGWFASGSVRLS